MGKQSFTLGQIVDLERPAYHETLDEDLDYVYDGINFWCQMEGCSRPVTSQDQVPREGWRHMLSCPCEVCRVADAA